MFEMKEKAHEAPILGGEGEKSSRSARQSEEDLSDGIDLPDVNLLDR
jgi:hypothetical protein